MTLLTKVFLTDEAKLKTVKRAQMKLFFLFLIIFTASFADAAHLHKEKEYQQAWCREAGGVTEYVLDDGTRVDCLTDEYAIEFDFAPKWAEAVGQALYYALKTGKSPGIALIIEKPGQERFLKRLQLLVAPYNIKLWTIVPSSQ